MPNLGELIARLVAVVGEILGETSLRLGPGPTLGILAVLLVLLHLVARPTSRWVTRDLGGLAAVGRGMALAAEAGSGVVVALGTAGIARAVPALDRLQTLAALPILAHVARAAARYAVPVRVITNDPLAEAIAAELGDDTHRRTETSERRGRSRAEFVGEGRAPMAAHAIAAATRQGVAFTAGGLSEEGLLVVHGLAERAGTSSSGTANPGQASSVLLSSDATLIGPQLFQAPADVRSGAPERLVSLAANRLLWAAIVVLMVGTALALGGVVDPGDFLVGAG
jgi:hypothetical protein